MIHYKKTQSFWKTICVKQGILAVFKKQNKTKTTPKILKRIATCWSKVVLRLKHLKLLKYGRSIYDTHKITEENMSSAFGTMSLQS